MSPGYLLPLLAGCLASYNTPRCCDPGHTLALHDADGSLRPRCLNLTADHEEGPVNASCPAEQLRAVPPGVDAECAGSALDGALVGLVCEARHPRCCRDDGRYDPDRRACSNGTGAPRPRRCPGAIVDHLVPAAAVRLLAAGGNSCVEATTLSEDLLVVRRCVPLAQACAGRPCLRKCCPDGESLGEDDQCAASDSFRLSLVPTSYDARQVVLAPGGSFAMAFGLDCPEGKYAIDPYSQDRAEFTRAGEILYEGETHGVDSYCVEGDAQGAVVVALCFPERGSAGDPSAVPIYITAGLVASSAFLLATLATYALLPPLLNLHGKTLVCHVASLLAAYVCLSTTHLGQEAFYRTGWCVAVAYMMIFSFMAAFSWLNVMCFDIWWTFSAVRCLTQGSRQRRERRRFLWYSAYSWSLATLVALLSFAGDSAGDLLPQQIRPLIGDDTCFYSHRTHSQKVFFELPVAVLTVANIVFFLLTARNCYKVKAELQRLQSKEGERGKRRFEANRNKMITTAKLFVVMGVTWVLEFTASLCSTGNKFWIPADIANSLQGVFIFCIFVLKRKVLRSLGQRLRLKACLRGNSSAEDGAVRPGEPGYELWRMRKISSNSTLYTNSTIMQPGSCGSHRAK
ncbi:G-protein coupled receptor Mth2-like [Bacillus rossius redtenbacheri]|uniref:G-protein coupled receptor Mth2-like n=1 Tax=Bacillus rossius redtenbacheri TaxID=93214 RepID=UPI002FDDA1F3